MSLSAIRRWHKWWFLPIEIGALLILAGWWWYTNFSPMGRLRASGAPMTFEDLAPEPIPDEENIAAGLRDLEPRIAEVPVGLYDFAADFRDLENPAERLVEAKHLLDPQADLIASLVRISERPRYASLLTPAEMTDPEAMINNPKVARPVSRLLDFEVRVALASGDLDRAVHATVATLRYAKAWEAEPFIVGRLIACAMQSIALSDANVLAARDDLTDEQIDRLLMGVKSLEDRSSVKDALASERVLSLVRLSEMPVVGLLNQSSVLLMYEEALAVPKTPLSRWASGGAQVSQRASQPLASLIAPALQAWFETEARVASEARAVREKLEARIKE